ncbi:hypothetical protein [Paenibacillus agaridevorans]|uniref:hypothetical protein n=1 Tax=Paenibacillus agaridevorans TaxID=171404 RepID=UPI001FED106E|nr:hypothetical protein [Paenibacillus agaridevorans]
MSEITNAPQEGGRTLTYRITSQWANFENEAINASLITDIILALDADDFIVLDPSEPVEGSSYLQAATAEGDGNGFVVELRLVNDDGTFKHYGYSTVDSNEVIRMFLQYWGEQKLPDWSNWTDMTDQFE